MEIFHFPISASLLKHNLYLIFYSATAKFILVIVNRFLKIFYANNYVFCDMLLPF